MNNDDENMKKAQQATDMVMMQDKLRDYQKKMEDLQNKVYQGNYQGMSIKMKGTYEIIEVHIDQSFYETAPKSLLEMSILTVSANLHRAIEADQKLLQEQMQNDLQRFQMEALANNNGSH